MTDLLRTVAAYLPQSLTRAALNGALSAPPIKPLTTRMMAAVLFADVSGFTPITEALGQKGSEGPEELTRLLNRYFSWMIAFVEAEGGEVVKFGGDALTVVFPAANETLGMATRRAMQAAQTMQTAMDEFGILESSVGLVSLKMKFGVGAGEVLTTQVGGIFNRWEYIIAGDALHQATQAENRARQGEIVLSPQAEAIIAPYALSPRPLPAPDWESVQNPEAVQEVLRYYIPGPVRSWLDGELHDWLATLRPMSVMFAGIKALDYSRPHTVDKLHTLLRSMQEVIYHYWGTLTRLTVDDKGTVLLVLFGAPPYSHEDDPERALRCALDLQQLATDKAIQLAVGVTAGRVFAGPVGGNTRREYTVMGDAVNLAARLMVAARAGDICCNYEAYRNAYDKINFEPLPPIEVKGKVDLVPVYRPTGIHHPARPIQLNHTEAGEPLIGRQAEVAKLAARLEQVQAGQSRIILIEGEAGIGKSRLVEELTKLTNNRQVTVLLERGVSIEQETPYYVWRSIFKAYFGLDDMANQPDRQQYRIQTRVGEVAPDVLEYLPILNKVLDLNLPDNEFTALLDDRLQQEKLVSLVLALLQSWAGEQPLVLILEDAHWFDLPSWKLAVHAAVGAIKEGWPLLLVLATRPLENVTMRTEATLLTSLAETEYIRLDSLSPDETLTLATRRLGLTSHELPEAVAALVRSRAGGNPFFAEEIFYTLHDNGFITFKTVGDKTRCLISGDLDRAAQTLPATIQSIILSRIDQLPPEKQLMLRVAAVIGHTFAFATLFDTLNQHLDIKAGLLKDQLNDLIYLGLIRPEAPEPNLSYTFKHVIIREVTYQTLLFNRRRQLHRLVAQWYEEAYGPEANGDFPPFESEISPNLSLALPLPPSSKPLAPYYSLLVYHWHQAGDDERERYYATRIAKQAVAQFANAEAISYLNRALDLTPGADLAERYELLLARETVYNRRGEREGQRQDLAALAGLVEKQDNLDWKITVALRQANYAEATGDYSTALSLAQEAVTWARQAQIPSSKSSGYALWGKVLLRQADYEAAQEKLEQALNLANTHGNHNGQAESLHYLATLAWLRGNYTSAQKSCQKTLKLCRVHGYRLIEAHTLNLLGLIRFYLGDYSAAQDYYEQAIALYYAMGERRGECKAFYNVGLIYLKQGHHETARDYFEQTLDIQREIGDREGTADTLSNLGITYCNLGDYNAARSYLGHSLEIRKEIDSRLGEANSLSKLGYVYHNSGDYLTTKRYCELALNIQQKIGSPENECYSLTYLGHALVALDQLPAATEAYNKALNLRRAMGQAAPAIDILAGLAHVSMAQDQFEQALNQVDEILAWIDTNGIAGIENPLWVYLTSYNILHAAAQDDPVGLDRARDVLATAYALLKEQAAGITHKKLQQKFLKNVKIHQDIMTIWETRLPISQQTQQQQNPRKQSKSFI